MVFWAGLVAESILAHGNRVPVIESLVSLFPHMSADCCCPSAPLLCAMLPSASDIAPEQYRTTMQSSQLDGQEAGVDGDAADFFDSFVNFDSTELPDGPGFTPVECTDLTSRPWKSLTTSSNGLKPDGSNGVSTQMAPDAPMHPDADILTFNLPIRPQRSTSQSGGLASDSKPRKLDGLTIRTSPRSPQILELAESSPWSEHRSSSHADSVAKGRDRTTRLYQKLQRPVHTERSHTAPSPSAKQALGGSDHWSLLKNTQSTHISETEQVKVDHCVSNSPTLSTILSPSFITNINAVEDPFFEATKDAQIRSRPNLQLRTPPPGLNSRSERPIHRRNASASKRSIRRTQPNGPPTAGLSAMLQNKMLWTTGPPVSLSFPPFPMQASDQSSMWWSDVDMSSELMDMRSGPLDINSDMKGFPMGSDVTTSFPMQAGPLDISLDMNGLPIGSSTPTAFSEQGFQILHPSELPVDFNTAPTTMTFDGLPPDDPAMSMLHGELNGNQGQASMLQEQNGLAYLDNNLVSFNSEPILPSTEVVYPPQLLRTPGSEPRQQPHTPSSSAGCLDPRYLTTSGTVHGRAPSADCSPSPSFRRLRETSTHARRAISLGADAARSRDVASLSPSLSNSLLSSGVQTRRSHTPTHRRNASNLLTSSSAGNFTSPPGGAGTPSRARRSASRTPSSSRTRTRGAAPSNTGGGIGFVNFTPDDVGVLMSGVAPSGSSKTKARRDKEAAERQRRINEAFVQAVAAAGGDPRMLEEKGLML
jgi:hypothetical protein